MKKILLHLLPLLALFAITARAADDAALIAAVRAADDERTAATKAADPARLNAIFSDQLHYGHSSAVLDTKTSYIESLTSKRTVYESFDYKERKFTVVAPGVVTMTGHAIIRAGAPGAINNNDLIFLAIWRLENGKWRFFAWQSCRNPPPAAAAPAKK